MEADKARALALRSAVLYANGKTYSKQDVLALAEEFFTYITTGKKPEPPRSW